MTVGGGVGRFEHPYVHHPWYLFPGPQYIFSFTLIFILVKSYSKSYFTFILNLHYIYVYINFLYEVTLALLLDPFKTFWKKV